MLLQRFISASIALPILVLMIWFGTGTTMALIAAASVIGIREFHRLAVRAGPTPVLFLATIGGVLFVVDAGTDFNFTMALITGLVLAPLFLLLVLGPRERFLSDWAWTLAGVFYVAWTLSHAVHISRHADGREWLLTAALLTFAVDTGAYFVGRLIGRNHMAPSISPGKTWEGAIAGLAVGIGASLAVTAGFGLPIGAWKAVVLGLLIGIFGQAGDLAESMIKRAAGVKDAGGLIPGHGGILDRLDSLIPSVVVLYYFLTYGLG